MEQEVMSYSLLELAVKGGLWLHDDDKAAAVEAVEDVDAVVNCQDGSVEYGDGLR